MTPHPAPKPDTHQTTFLTYADKVKIEITDAEAFAQDLREDILKHFEALKLPALNGNGSNGSLSKDAIRSSHAYQRSEVFQREYKVLRPSIKRLIKFFANGDEVHPEAIDPELILVDSGNYTGRLFRLACLLWTVPVSQGYGRRMRFLVKDRSNDKLIGIFALGDPVFNLKCRDQMIGWNANDRRARLVNVMDAYVVGAVPPYNQLLGGKLVASLMCSQEVSTLFTERYRDTTGIISQKQKSPKLALITVTSALGRSSLYNRLKLVNYGVPTVNFQKIGETRGYGHFQISGELFERMRALLALEGHVYANGHQYGDGPNWRMRVTRVGLKRLGLDDELIKHGIHREVYWNPLARNFKLYLRGEDEQPHIELASTAEISRVALRRWVVPRAKHNHEFLSVDKQELLKELCKIAS
jgi:hypothetical protein